MPFTERDTGHCRFRIYYFFFLCFFSFSKFYFFCFFFFFVFFLPTTTRNNNNEMKVDGECVHLRIPAVVGWPRKELHHHIHVHLCLFSSLSFSLCVVFISQEKYSNEMGNSVRSSLPPHRKRKKKKKKKKSHELRRRVLKRFL